MTAIWQDHSLTIVLALIGAALTAFGFSFDEGRWFDLFMGLGQGTLTVALFYFLAQFFREKAKPEDPPNAEV